MKLTLEVVGMKAFKGVIDGKAIDSGALYTRVKMDDRRNEVGDGGVTASWKMGESTEEWKLPSAEHVLRMKHLKCPFPATLEIERMSNGRETKDVVTDVVPMAGSAVVQEPVRKVA